MRLQFITKNSRETKHSSTGACLCSRSMALRFLQVYEACKPWVLPSSRNGPSHLLCILPCCLFFGMRRRTRSPSLISRGLTFLLHHLRVSSWYLPRLIARLCFDGFDRVDCWLDVFVRCFGPVGSMAKFFWCHCLFAICDQITFGSSSTHLPFGCSVMFFLIPEKMIPFALSTAPFDCG